MGKNNIKIEVTAPESNSRNQDLSSSEAVIDDFIKRNREILDEIYRDKDTGEALSYATLVFELERIIKWVTENKTGLGVQIIYVAEPENFKHPLIDLGLAEVSRLSEPATIADQGDKVPMLWRPTDRATMLVDSYRAAKGLSTLEELYKKRQQKLLGRRSIAA